jgi:hypothetical protein
VPASAGKAENPARNVAVSPDGKQVAIWKDAEVRCLDTDSGKLVWRLAAVQAGKLYSVDASTGKIMSVDQPAKMFTFAFSADGKKLSVSREAPAVALDPATAADKKGVISGSTLKALIEHSDAEIRDLGAKLARRLAQRHQETMNLPGPGAQLSGEKPRLDTAGRARDTTLLWQEIHRLQKELEDLKRKVETLKP